MRCHAAKSTRCGHDTESYVRYNSTCVTLHFASTAELENHFQNHVELRGEFNFATADAYRAAAEETALAAGSATILRCTRTDGETMTYEPCSTGLLWGHHQALSELCTCRCGVKARVGTNTSDGRHEEAEVTPCPVCSYPDESMTSPPEPYSICPGCGTEFGLDDEVTSHAELRAEWLRKGAKWFSHHTPPPLHGNALRQVGLEAVTST